MPFAAGHSCHPHTATATAEVIGSVLDELAAPVDLAVVFASAGHRDQLGDAAGAIATVLAPRAMIGATAIGIVGGASELEDQPALALLVATFPPGARAPEAHHLTVEPSAEGAILAGLPQELDRCTAAILLADPLSFPVDAVIELLGRARPGIRLVGGLASASFEPDGNRLVCDGECTNRGAVLLTIPDDTIGVDVVVSQGCRPIGDPATVTAASGQRVEEVAGRSALIWARDLLATLAPSERDLAMSGLHIGRVVDEQRDEFTQGDFLIRNVVGLDEDAGALIVNDRIAVGSTIQLQARDATSASLDLHAALAGVEADAGLVFTCNGRGSHLFGAPGHDAEAVARHTPRDVVAGMFCAGEIGPVGGEVFLHGFTASVALLSDP